jgi:hypothetical protein
MERINYFNRFNIFEESENLKKKENNSISFNFLNEKIITLIFSFSSDKNNLKFTNKFCLNTINNILITNKFLKKNKNVKSYSILELPKEFFKLPIEMLNNKNEENKLTINLLPFNLKFKFNKVILMNKINKLNNLNELLELKEGIMIIICHGGQFSGGYFKNGEAIVHKNFKKYITRKKQGKRQSNKDQSSHPKSMGAFLRRTQEIKFNETVIDYINVKWKKYIDESKYIFLNAPGHNLKELILNENSSIKKNDKRIKTIPFQTNSITFEELNTIQRKLFKLKLILK